MLDQGIDPLNPETASGASPAGSNWSEGPQMNMHFSGGDPNEIFKMFFGGNGGETFFQSSSGDGNNNLGNFKFFKMGGDGNGKHGFTGRAKNRTTK